jgi:hypothetical protein
MVMTHDPLCPYRPDVAVDYGEWVKGKPCYCGLIAKVRADERKNMSDRVVHPMLTKEKRGQALQNAVDRMTAAWDEEWEDDGYDNS